MLYLMRDMREISAPRLQLFNVFKRAFQPQMSFVRANAQTVEHQHFQITQAFNGCRRNLTQIGGVGKVVEAISNHGQAAVNNFKGSYLDISADAKRRAVHNCMRHNLWQATAEMRRLKDVLENSPDVFPGAFVCVKTER